MRRVISPWISIVTLLSLGGSCTEPEANQATLCGAGGELHLSGEPWRYCVYDRTGGAVQETGFSCPSELAAFFESAGAYVCAEAGAAESGWFPPGMAGGKPAALDVLVVVDGSASMCQEQTAIADAASAMAALLAEVDIRVAVVTTDVLSEDKMGAFQHRKTTQFPYACLESRPMVCIDGSSDTTCTDALGPHAHCSAAPVPINCNGSINSRCQYQCESDSECDGAILGDSAGASCGANAPDCVYQCVGAGWPPEFTGCVLRPKTDQCPESALMPAVLDGSNVAHLLPCIAVVGADQHNNANLEAGLLSAVMALDPTGPNAADLPSFLRPDAHLLVLFITDEDDCSMVDPAALPKEQYGLCAYLTDETADPPGPLASTAKLAAQLKAFKSDPERVHVALIVGDSLATDPVDVSMERAAYRQSKCGVCADPEIPYGFNSYICASSAGRANFGGRYVEFAGHFGERAHLYNICDPAGAGSAIVSATSKVRDTITNAPPAPR